MGGKIEDSPFYKVLKADTTTTVVMNLDQMAASLLRAWCDFEFYFSHVLRKSLVLNSRFGPLRRLGCSSDCGKVAELWMLHVFELLQDVDINLATATREEDLELIRSEIASFVGTGVAEGLRGADALNRLLKSMIASEVLPALARIGDLSRGDPRAREPRSAAAAGAGRRPHSRGPRGAHPEALPRGFRQAEGGPHADHSDAHARAAQVPQDHAQRGQEALAQLGEEAPPFAKNIADRLCVPDDNSNASAVLSAVPTPRGGLPVIRTPEAPQSPREGDAAIASSRLHSPRIDGDEKWSVTVQEAAAVLLHQSQPGAKPKARDNMLDPDSPISQNSTAIRGNFTPVGRLKGLSKLEARAARQKRQMRPPEIQVSSRASSAAGSQGLQSPALGSRAASKAPSLGAASSSPEKENLAFSRQTSVASASQGMQKPPVDAEELGERRASGSQGSQTPVEGLPLSRSHSRSSQGNQTPVGGFPQLFSRTSSRSSTKLLELKGTSCSSLGGRAASSTQYNMPVVMEHLESEDSGLRMAACEVLLDLGKTAAAQALPQLSELLEDRCDGVRRAALGVMAQMGCETLEAEHVEKTLVGAVVCLLACLFVCCCCGCCSCLFVCLFDCCCCCLFVCLIV
ncbi:unnamed protein product [Polarella glacialis]|uniref:Uncharacterized protein n=1 Tax=Polarella glacialis TaxID=89957 RepID=A0A813DVE2_POLGL|nr:unnamed protein product [Polarella glacialis]